MFFIRILRAIFKEKVNTPGEMAVSPDMNSSVVDMYKSPQYTCSVIEPLSDPMSMCFITRHAFSHRLMFPFFMPDYIAYWSVAHRHCLSLIIKFPPQVSVLYVFI